MEDDPFEFEDRLRKPDEYWLKDLWNNQFWSKPLRLHIAAAILTPLGLVVGAPWLAGRAVQIYAQRWGSKHAFRWGVAFGLLWLVLFFSFPFVQYFWLPHL